MSNHGQGQVRVFGGIPVPGEVLAARQNPRGRHPARQRQPQRCDTFGCAPQGRSPITGLSAFVATSSTGAKFQPMPRAASSDPRARPTCSANAGSFQPCHGRPNGQGRSQPLDAAAFLVNGQDVGQSTPGDVQTASRKRVTIRVTWDGAEMLGPNSITPPGARPQMREQVFGGVLTLETHHQQLTARLSHLGPHRNAYTPNLKRK